MNNLTNRQKGIIALIFLTVIFASMGLFVRYLNTGFALLQQVYLRVFAAFCLSLIFFHREINLKKIPKISVKEWGLIVFRAISMYLIGVTLFSKAILETKYSNVSFIAAIPLVALYGFVFFKEKVSLKKILLISLSFIGVVIISVTDYSNVFQFGYGELLAFISAISFGLSYVARKWHSDLLNNKEITVLIFLVSAFIVFTVSVLVGEGIPILNNQIGLLTAVLGSGLFNVFNLYLTNFGFQHVEAVLASNLLTLESVFAVLLGFIFYRELPLTRELIGGIIIIISVVYLNKIQEKEFKTK